MYICRLFRKYARNEGQCIVECRVPILPSVTTVAYSQLIGYTRLAHCQYKVHIALEKEVIVTAIDIPHNRAKCLFGLVVGIGNVIHATQLVYRLCQVPHLILLIARCLRLRSIQVHQCAHSVASAEHIGMTLGITC